MPLTLCPKCGNHHYEIKRIRPINDDEEQTVVQCDACGCMVGVLDFRQEEMLAQIAARVTSIERYLAAVANALQR